MPLQDLYYPDKNNWDPGPIYGGWLAGQRENEAQLLRLMQLYNNAQEIQGKGLELDKTRRMNPLDIEKAQLGNLSAQQGIDLKLPEQGLANMQANNPAFMQGAFNVSKGAQEAQLDDQELQKRIGHYDQMIEALQDGGPLAVVSVAKNLGVPVEKLQPLLNSPEPLKAFIDRRYQLVGQVASKAKPDVLAKERGDLSKAELAALAHIRGAEIMANSREDVAAMRAAGGGTPRPMTTDQLFAKGIMDKVANGEMDLDTGLETIAKYKSAQKQQGLTLEGTPQGLQRQSQVPILNLPSKGKPTTVLTPEQRARIIQELQNRNKGK